MTPTPILTSAFLVLMGLTVALAAPGARASDDAALWAALKEGRAAVLIRHALAPGTGDPAAFQVDDCSTQRNLNDVGRAQAGRIGDMFRENGIETARVLSSQWCRCLDTATEMALGPVEETPFLNSFFRRSEYRDERTMTARTFLREADLSVPTVLVTHQVNITALVDIFPSSGELIFVGRPDSDGRVEIIGTIETR